MKPKVEVASIRKKEEKRRCDSPKQNKYFHDKVVLLILHTYLKIICKKVGENVA